jgi:outer membrane protein, heavy metal efflux system
MRAGVICVAIVAVLSPVRSGAQTLMLSEADVVKRLTPDNPLVQAARAGVELVRSEVLAAGRWPNPSVSFTHESAGGVSEGMFIVAQPMPLTGRRGLEVRSAVARADAASERAEDRVRRLRADVRLSFVEFQAATARERALTHGLERLRELATVLAHREDAGDAAGFDRLRVEREVMDAEAQRATAAADKRRAQTVLAGLLRIPDPASIEPVNVIGESPVRASLAEYTAHADAARADLRAMRHDADAARFAGDAAARRWLPEPEIVAGSKSSNAGSGDTGSIVGVRLAVPLFDRGQTERAAAAARAGQARVEAEALRQSLHAQIAGWRAAVVEREAAARQYLEASKTAAEIARIAHVSYDAGERGILELLDAHRTLTDTELRRAALDAAVRQAEIELHFVSAWEVR